MCLPRSVLCVQVTMAASLVTADQQSHSIPSHIYRSSWLIQSWWLSRSAMPRAAVSHKYVSVRLFKNIKIFLNIELYSKILVYNEIWCWQFLRKKICLQFSLSIFINSLIQSELQRCLEDNDFRGFSDALESAREIDYDLDQNYGKEVGYKTILHLALDEDDHDTTRYIEGIFGK